MARRDLIRTRGAYPQLDALGCYFSETNRVFSGAGVAGFSGLLAPDDAAASRFLISQMTSRHGKMRSM
jgi:hypothetical protein